MSNQEQSDHGIRLEDYASPREAAAAFKAKFPRKGEDIRSAIPDLVTRHLDVTAIWAKRNSIGIGLQRAKVAPDD